MIEIPQKRYQTIAAPIVHQETKVKSHPGFDGTAGTEDDLAWEEKGKILSPATANLEEAASLLDRLTQENDKKLPDEEAAVAALKDPDALVSERAATSLGKIGDPRAVVPLERRRRPQQLLGAGHVHRQHHVVESS